MQKPIIQPIRKKQLIFQNLVPSQFFEIVRIFFLYKMLYTSVSIQHEVKKVRIILPPETINSWQNIWHNGFQGTDFRQQSDPEMGNKWDDPYDCLERISKLVKGGRTHVEIGRLSEFRRWSWDSGGIKVSRLFRIEYQKGERYKQREYILLSEVL